MFWFRWYPDSSNLMPRFGLESMALHLQISVVGLVSPQTNRSNQCFCRDSVKRERLFCPFSILFELFLRIRLQKLYFVF